MLLPESETENSASIDEELNSSIETNLRNSQLAFIQNSGENTEFDLSIISNENPFIKFPKSYMNFNLSISLILPDKEERHNYLKLVSVNNKYIIHDGDFVFKIKKSSKTLKLDNIGIEVTGGGDDNTENPARLLFQIFDNNEKLITSFKTKIIQKGVKTPIEESIGKKEGNTIEISESNASKELCLVMNQIKFDKENRICRKSGFEKDIIEIKKVFTEILNYYVKTDTIKTTEDFKQVIQGKLKNFKDNHEHIVVFVLSTGDDNGFYTHDGYITFDEFVKLFSQITNKPKIFFFSLNVEKQLKSPKIIFESDNKIEITSNSSENSNNKNIPEYSNVFMGISPDSKYNQNGTPYIQILLNVIRENCELEVTEIQNETQCRMKGYLSTPYVYNCLTKKVQFKRKKNE